MTPPSHIALATLARYCEGVASPEERAAVHRWIGDDPDRRAALTALREAWVADLARLGGRDAEAHDVEAMVARLARDIAPRAVRPVRAAGHFRQAAAIVGVAVLGVAGWQIAARGIRRDPGHQYATTAGQRATIDLRDGTHVVLAPESRLDVPADFGRGARDLTLTGEGHFTVRHDARHPFRVHTTNSVTEDIGTTFVISAYPEQHTTQVVVAEGEVAFSGLALGPGDLGQIDATGHATRTPGADLAPFTAWTSGTLVFHGAPVREALPVISRWFDLDLRTTDTMLAASHLVATFTASNPTDMLQTLAIALDARYTRTGRTVVFVARHHRR